MIKGRLARDVTPFAPDDNRKLAFIVEFLGDGGAYERLHVSHLTAGNPVKDHRLDRNIHTDFVGVCFEVASQAPDGLRIGDHGVKRQTVETSCRTAPITHRLSRALQAVLHRQKTTHGSRQIGRDILQANDLVIGYEHADSGPAIVSKRN
ncbi:hypothetical protein D3C86_1355140 [compost metagenome]